MSDAAAGEAGCHEADGRVEMGIKFALSVAFADVGDFGPLGLLGDKDSGEPKLMMLDLLIFFFRITPFSVDDLEFFFPALSSSLGDRDDDGGDGQDNS